MYRKIAFTICIIILCVLPPAYASNTSKEIGCESRLYVNKNWHEVFEICKPYADNGDSYARLMVALFHILTPTTEKFKKQGIETLSILSTNRLDEARFWLGRLMFLGVIPKVNGKSALVYLNEVKWDTKAAALVTIAQIYANGMGHIDINLKRAKYKFIEAAKLLKSRDEELDLKFNSLKIKKIFYPPLPRKQYLVFLGKQAIYQDSSELILAIEKHGFTQREIFGE